MGSGAQVTRRQFHTVAALSLGVPSVITARAAGKTAANDRITMGFIGIGIMGRGHLSRFIGYDDIQVVAASDVVQERLDHAAKMVTDKYSVTRKDSFKGVDAYKDYRALLERDDIDAVLIATPDHWHAIPIIQAAHSGKDIYCEKPLTHNVVEGRKIVRAV
ncbi:MAG: Gfo/Idh/MocA family oxidoreductase, partial [Pirellulaceae bacterium]